MKKASTDEENEGLVSESLPFNGPVIRPQANNVCQGKR